MSQLCVVHCTYVHMYKFSKSMMTSASLLPPWIVIHQYLHLNNETLPPASLLHCSKPCQHSLDCSLYYTLSHCSVVFSFCFFLRLFQFLWLDFAASCIYLELRLCHPWKLTDSLLIFSCYNTSYLSLVHNLSIHLPNYSVHTDVKLSCHHHTSLLKIVLQWKIFLFLSGYSHTHTIVSL